MIKKLHNDTSTTKIVFGIGSQDGDIEYVFGRSESKTC